MSIKYGVLVGRVIGGDREDNDPKSPHYTIFISGSEHTYRALANVQSQDGSEVLYFHGPISSAIH